jgi:hypothetical protein
MKIIALFVATLLVLVGLTGVLWPEGLMALAAYSFTGSGLYVVGAARIILGGLLVLAATATRTPKTVRVIGLIVLAAGIATALIPADRALAMKDMWLSRGPEPLRIAACFPLAVGIFIGLSALTKPRKP